MERLVVNEMYFNGIKNGKITAIFFDHKVLDVLKKGDLFEIYNSSEERLKMYLNEVKILSFGEVTDKLVQKAGFATKELLAYHLCQRYNITAFPLFGGVGSTINEELFCVVTFSEDIGDIYVDDGEVKKYLNETSIDQNIIYKTDFSPQDVRYPNFDVDNLPFELDEAFNPEYIVPTYFYQEEMKK